MVGSRRVFTSVRCDRWSLVGCGVLRLGVELAGDEDGVEVVDVGERFSSCKIAVIEREAASA